MIERSISEAEQNTLGAFLNDPHAILKVMDTLLPAHFYFGDHREIYEAMLALISDSKPVDMVMLGQLVPQHYDCVMNIYKSVAGSANVEHYAAHVTRFWEQRELIRVGREIQALGMEGGDIGQAMGLLMELRGVEAGGLVHPKPRMAAVVAYIEERHEHDGGLIGQSTGLADLDSCLSGYRDGMLYIIAGRPSMGKTALALQTIIPTAEAGKPVLVFSMEMPSRELDLRILSNVGNIPQEAMQHAKFSEEQWPRFTAATSRVSNELPIYIDDAPAQSLAAISAKCKREALRLGKLGAVAVDYIGLMRGNGEASRTLEMGAISRGLKGLAKELGCPVIALAQLNRKCEDRADKRPMMSDLRDSGEIEQDADAVIMVYRDSVYNKDSPFAKNCVAELLLRKNRHGETKEIRVIDQLNYSRFRNADYTINQIENTVRKQSADGGYG